MLKDVDLTTVCYLIVKAREFGVKMAPETPDPGSNPVDDQDRGILFDYADDPTAQEVTDAIAGMSEVGRIELLALVLLGRGDVSDWPEAVRTAADAPERRTARAFMSIPLLPSYLEEGLSQIGLDCAETEAERL